MKDIFGESMGDRAKRAVDEYNAKQKMKIAQKKQGQQ